MLTSPNFLYRAEEGNGGSVHLTQYEIASRISYLFLGSMPDDALFAAADQNTLGDASARNAHALRLLAIRARGKRRSPSTTNG